jgi:hypothetical protein
MLIENKRDIYFQTREIATHWKHGEECEGGDGDENEQTSSKSDLLMFSSPEKRKQARKTTRRKQQEEAGARRKLAEKNILNSPVDSLRR